MMVKVKSNSGSVDMSTVDFDVDEISGIVCLDEIKIAENDVCVKSNSGSGMHAVVDSKFVSVNEKNEGNTYKLESLSVTEIDVGIVVGKNLVPGFMNNLKATDNLSVLPGIGVCFEAGIGKNTVFEGGVFPLEMNDWVKAATIFRGGTMLLRMMVWVQLATCFRGGTKVAGGYRELIISLDE
ncbi:OLC1v1009872C1 [Oldenlandia corymbosa var. corymbosa]|uniref:OLC1v1009872C1 n=1 Tax=Oldenlandia corymbosa var. corymbosa TaxID=529605 RepID=A0AAV1DSK1_OLDCO|nr:OLC1v1009872C1 [Oldenlandia corymbosa var. corymbosa]